MLEKYANWKKNKATTLTQKALFGSLLARLFIYYIPVFLSIFLFLNVIAIVFRMHFVAFYFILVLSILLPANIEFWNQKWRRQNSLSIWKNVEKEAKKIKNEKEKENEKK